MPKYIDREKANDILHAVQHALYHFKQSNLDEEGHHAMPNLIRAERQLKEAMLSDVVFASTAAKQHGAGIEVGVTAHCRCGHAFAFDIEAALDQEPE